ncbi:MAG: hypothetical protein WCV93_05020 [Candidatus Shapirobacteria bacterium]|jgi:hypothetical protein
MAREYTNPWLPPRDYEPKILNDRELANHLRQLGTYAGHGLINKASPAYVQAASVVAYANRDIGFSREAIQYDSVTQYFNPAITATPGILAVRDAKDDQLVVLAISGADGQYQADLTTLMKAYTLLSQRLDIRAGYTNLDDLFDSLRTALVSEVGRLMTSTRVSIPERLHSSVTNESTRPREAVQSALARMRR